MNTKSIAPATSGKCSIVGCEHVADIEIQERVAAGTWRVSRSCMDHLTKDEAALVAEAMQA